MGKPVKSKEKFWDIECANKVADALKADILLINAPIERGLDNRLITEIMNRKRRKNVFLILVTEGGNADAAYRIARYLQDFYDRFIAFITGYCKSAGTLCVLGANEIVIGNVGELGPLDVQVAKKDELFEYSSGLVSYESLRVLQEIAFEMYEEYMLRIEFNSGGRITFKTATEIAMTMTTGLLEPLYRQIDPIQIGEMARSMEIATAYGKRLMVKSKNFTIEKLEFLKKQYPSHGFVIDKYEVKDLFNNVRQPTMDEETLMHSLEKLGYEPQGNENVYFLSDEIRGDKNEKTTGSIE